MKTNYDAIQIPDHMILLKFLDNKVMCAMDVFKGLNIAYSHIHKLKHTFVKLGWIVLKKEDRKLNMIITNKGKSVVKNINNYLKDIGFNDIDKIKKYLYKDKKNVVKKKEIEDEEIINELLNKIK